MNAENVLVALGLSTNEARVLLRAYRREQLTAKAAAKAYARLERAKEKSNVALTEFIRARDRIAFLRYNSAIVD